MAFIVDASIAGAWLLPDEENTIADQMMERMVDEDAWAPDLLRHEIRSILLSAERRGRISDDLIHSALARFRALPLKLVGPGDDTEVVRLSRQYRLSAYDAAYLAIALIEYLPLATLDRKLADAARKEGVNVLGSFADGP
ncbi:MULTISPECIES: type II toxin-antitoxin system VapC family toxin [unclassified Rhizobium]|uniref:type II toxin-antitoxin system VapC family toxin n=1 Tax=unclassified Rhizobium TaxID=2613769 RepID=UPI001ADC3677|nr:MULTISPECIES: type II toxin-antitoxin system VapC family toxin [unclassified Rhizobium]MBO9102058.1 type II toxin-antitoxin system VapC family toxin [Rhizobium sp. L58/93]MBO9172144.1 type II toxin-antitoxin system VapC family toxin [Rhizobium sp. L245/93]QXZ88159.1 type II toxin-antitoxin system VapC family toxin [Rhizobium sp. K1/93]QXZ94333.1 type II toxin-antitoxin system VapC family toxin [Rhizobium sp. K15/93]QYA05775.1 type II toxin-antitoxin system VapC family toxin [Rhizobium sp. B